MYARSADIQSRQSLNKRRRIEMAKQKTCRERVTAHRTDRIRDLRKLWETYQEDPDKYLEDLGNMYEYGLSFDYVAPGTFEDQEQGYFRYQLSWGGPSDEFRFYCGPEFIPYRIEYWFLDWFDGASVTLQGKDKELLFEIFDWFEGMGSVKAEFDKAQE